MTKSYKKTRKVKVNNRTLEPLSIDRLRNILYLNDQKFIQSNQTPESTQEYEKKRQKLLKLLNKKEDEALASMFEAIKTYQNKQKINKHNEKSIDYETLQKKYPFIKGLQKDNQCNSNIVSLDSILISENKRKVSQVKRAAGYFIPLTISASIASGCATPGYIASTEADRKRIDAITEQEFGGVENTVREFNKNITFTKDGKYKIQDAPLPVLFASDELENWMDEDGDEISSRDYMLFKELEKQNKLLGDLYKNSKLQRKVIHDIKNNMAFEAFDAPTGLQNSDLQEITQTMVALQYSLSNLKASDIEKIQKKVAEKAEKTGNKKLLEEFKEIVENNKMLKEQFKRLALISANANTHELRMNKVNAAVDLYVSLEESLSGKNLYNEGESLYNSLKQRKLGDVASGDSHVIKQGKFNPNDSIEKVVNTLFKKISDESGNNGRHSRHTIAQEHYMQLKNIISEAHKNRVLIGKDEESNIKTIADYNQLNNERAIALEKYFSSEIAKHMLNGINEDQGVSIGSTLASLIPFFGIYKMIASAKWAFAKDNADFGVYGQDDGLKLMLYKAGHIKYGIENHDHIVGSKDADVADFYAGLGSTVLTAVGLAGGSYFLISSLFKTGNQPIPSPGTGPAYGGETGGPGTQNSAEPSSPIRKYQHEQEKQEKSRRFIHEKMGTYYNGKAA